MWDKFKEQFNLLKLEKKKLCLITNSDKFISNELFLDAIASAIQGGVDIVQLKETTFPDYVMAEIAKKVRVICDEFGATFVVNGRCDIAQIAEADGVHLEGDSVNISDARTIMGEHSVIGITAYSTEDVIKAYNEGVDYINFALEFNKKKNEIVNADDIRWLNDNIDIPIFITGEINLDNIDIVVKTGTNKIAVTNSLMYAQIPEETAQEFVKFLP